MHLFNFWCYWSKVGTKVYVNNRTLRLVSVDDQYDVAKNPPKHTHIGEGEKKNLLFA